MGDTFAKRNREQKKRQRKQDKAARKQERVSEKAAAEARGEAIDDVVSLEDMIEDALSADRVPEPVEEEKPDDEPVRARPFTTKPKFGGSGPGRKFG